MKPPPLLARAQCCARDLIAELEIEAPSEIEVEKIAAFKHAPVRYADIRGCDGHMARSSKNAIITVRSSINRLGQRRFVIAHELGHVLLHPQVRQVDDVDERQTRNFSLRQEPEEMEANFFAAELLMPHTMFSKDAADREPSWDSMRDLADRYRTTYSSTAIQYLRCTKEAVFLSASENGMRKWFSFSESGRDFFLSDVARIHHYTCAKELLESNKTRASADNVPAGAWFRGFDPNGKECIVEDSMRARDSSFVLSLIWIRDDI